jgi:hypothetical protein
MGFNWFNSNRWKSYFEPEKTVLMTNVQDSVFQLFQRVENKVIVICSYHIFATVTTPVWWTQNRSRKNYEIPVPAPVAQASTAPALYSKRIDIEKTKMLKVFLFSRQNLQPLKKKKTTRLLHCSCMIYSSER